MTLPLPAGATSASTSASACGAHGSNAPVDDVTAARRDRGWLPTTVNAPPRYTVLPETSMSSTRALTFAFQPVRTAPVVGSSATARLRATPETDVKSPPTKMRDPSAAAAMLVPCASRVGAQLEINAPVERL